MSLDPQLLFFWATRDENLVAADVTRCRAAAGCWLGVHRPARQRKQRDAGQGGDRRRISRCFCLGELFGSSLSSLIWRTVETVAARSPERLPPSVDVPPVS